MSKDKTFSDKFRDLIGLPEATGGRLRGSLRFAEGLKKMKSAKEAAKKRQKNKK